MSIFGGKIRTILPNVVFTGLTLLPTVRSSLQEPHNSVPPSPNPISLQAHNYLTDYGLQLVDENVEEGNDTNGILENETIDNQSIPSLKDRVLMTLGIYPPQSLGTSVVYSSAQNLTPDKTNAYSIHDNMEWGKSAGSVDPETGEVEKFKRVKYGEHILTEVVPPKDETAILVQINTANMFEVEDKKFKFNPDEVGYMVIKSDDQIVYEGPFGDLFTSEKYKPLRDLGIVQGHNENGNRGGGFGLRPMIAGKNLTVLLENPEWVDITVNYKPDVPLSRSPETIDELVEEATDLSYLSNILENPAGKRSISPEHVYLHDPEKTFMPNKPVRVDSITIPIGDVTKLEDITLSLNYEKNSTSVNLGSLFGVAGYTSLDPSNIVTDNTDTQNFLTHGIIRENGEIKGVYINYPIELEPGETLTLSSSDNKFSENVPKIHYTEIPRKGSEIVFYKSKVSTEELLNGTYNPTALLSGGTLYEVVSRIDYSRSEDSTQGDPNGYLRWTMPPLEGETYVIAIIKDGHIVRSAISGYESLTPGGGFHFLSGEETMSAQLPNGGVVWYLKKVDNSQTTDVIYGGELGTVESATVVASPYISVDDSDFGTVFMPMTPTFNPELLRYFHTQTNTLAVIYTNSDSAVKNINSASNFPQRDLLEAYNTLQGHYDPEFAKAMLMILVKHGESQDIRNIIDSNANDTDTVNIITDLLEIDFSDLDKGLVDSVVANSFETGYNPELILEYIRNHQSSVVVSKLVHDNDWNYLMLIVKKALNSNTDLIEFENDIVNSDLKDVSLSNFEIYAIYSTWVQLRNLEKEGSNYEGESPEYTDVYFKVLSKLKLTLEGDALNHRLRELRYYPQWIQLITEDSTLSTEDKHALISDANAIEFLSLGFLSFNKDNKKIDEFLESYTYYQLLNDGEDCNIYTYLTFLSSVFGDDINYIYYYDNVDTTISYINTILYLAMLGDANGYNSKEIINRYILNSEQFHVTTSYWHRVKELATQSSFQYALFIDAFDKYYSNVSNLNEVDMLSLYKILGHYEHDERNALFQKMLEITSNRQAHDIGGLIEILTSITGSEDLSWLDPRNEKNLIAALDDKYLESFLMYKNEHGVYPIESNEDIIRFFIEYLDNGGMGGIRNEYILDVLDLTIDIVRIHNYLDVVLVKDFINKIIQESELKQTYIEIPDGLEFVIINNTVENLRKNSKEQDYIETLIDVLGIISKEGFIDSPLRVIYPGDPQAYMLLSPEEDLKRLHLIKAVFNAYHSNALSIDDSILFFKPNTLTYSEYYALIEEEMEYREQQGDTSYANLNFYINTLNWWNEIPQLKSEVRTINDFNLFIHSFDTVQKMDFMSTNLSIFVFSQINMIKYVQQDEQDEFFSSFLQLSSSNESVRRNALYKIMSLLPTSEDASVRQRINEKHKIMIRLCNDYHGYDKEKILQALEDYNEYYEVAFKYLWPDATFLVFKPIIDDLQFFVEHNPDLTSSQIDAIGDYVNFLGIALVGGFDGNGFVRSSGSYGSSMLAYMGAKNLNEVFGDKIIRNLGQFVKIDTRFRDIDETFGSRYGSADAKSYEDIGKFLYQINSSPN